MGTGYSKGAQGGDALGAAMGQAHGPTLGGGCGCGGGEEDYFDDVASTLGGHEEPHGYFGGGARESAHEDDPVRDLRAYEESVSAKAKENVVRQLGRALQRVGIDVDPEGDLDEIPARLSKQLPHPRNGKTFAADARAQEKVCRVVADVLNDEYTPGETQPHKQLIDTTLGAEGICRSVAEWAHSFTMGVNTEFLAVTASVKNILRRVALLDRKMTTAHAEIMRRAASSLDPAAEREVAALEEGYYRAQNARRLAEEVLRNILHVQLSPAMEGLGEAMRDVTEQRALIKDPDGAELGSAAASDMMAIRISTLGSAAKYAIGAHNALKKAGKSVEEFLNSPAWAEFNRSLDARVEDRTLKYDELEGFLSAVKELRDYFGYRKDPEFRGALLRLEERVDEGNARRGGAEYKSTVVKRVDRLAAEKKILVQDFVARLSRHYEEFLRAIEEISPKLGTEEIPLTDRTNSLRDAVARLRGQQDKHTRLELSLIGLHMDAKARAQKEQYVESLRHVASACSSIMAVEIYRSASSHFARLKASADSIIKTIDYFADVIANKYGGNSNEQEKLGGAGDEDLKLPTIARSAYNLNEAASKFAYAYYVAKVRSNLHRTAAEVEGYGSNYSDLLGTAVAARLYNLETERKTRLAFLNDPANRGAGAVLQPAFDPADVAKQAAFVEAQGWINREYNTKARFYTALQAVDLYMKEFTSGIVNDPDAVRDIKKMLDGVTSIARWFNEETGDNVWKAFECMGRNPNFGAGGKGVPPVVGSPDFAAVARDSRTDGHYYSKLADAASYGAIAAGEVGRHLGIPQCSIILGSNVSSAVTAALPKKYVEEAYENFQALKNLISAFARIGSKFNGKEVKVFRSPTQIYRALMDYLKQSALSMRENIANEALEARGDMVRVAAAAVRGEAYFGSCGSGVPQGSYEVEDRYFALVVKAMAAKVLTVIGVYDMFERTSPLYDLTPTRMIVGGGSELDPEVHEGAAELYFRLPRLAEFYYLLRWNGTDGEPQKIAMLPELEGVFSGIIRLIFMKASIPEDGNYPDGELREMVKEINTIYLHFKNGHGDQACAAALSAFIAEINRRYGVISKEDMVAYWKMVNLSRKTDSSELSNTTSYSILPGEDEDDIELPAPSSYAEVSPLANYDPSTLRPLDPSTGLPIDPFRNLTKQGRELDTEHAINGKRDMLRKFRDKIEKKFEQVGRAGFRTKSYSLLIDQAVANIRRSPTLDAKLVVAYKLIQGSGQVSANVDKAFMFHETVAVGLNMLCTVQTTLARFDALVRNMDPQTIENDIMDRIHFFSVGTGAAGGGGAGAAGNAAAFAGVAGMHGHGIYGAVGGLPAFGANDVPYAKYVLPLDGASGGYRERSGITMTQIEVAGFMSAMQTWYRGACNQARAAALVAGMLPNPPSSYTEEAPPALNQNQLQALRAFRVYARFAVNYELIMADYIENCFALKDGHQGLIEVRMTADGIHFGFGKLRSHVEELFRDVKYFIDILRPHLPKNIISRYEDRANPGSVYWLEENLIDKFFLGRFADSVETRRSDTVDGISLRAAAVLGALRRETLVTTQFLVTAQAAAISVFADLGGGAGATTLMGVIAAAPDWLTGASRPTRKEDFGRVYSRLIFYDGSANDCGLRELSGVATVAGANQAGPPPAGEYNYPLNQLIRRVGVAAPIERAAGGEILRRLPLYSVGNGENYRSLMFSFNQLLANYLATVTDQVGGNKIYFNLINSLANGVMSRAVANPAENAWPDLHNSNVELGRRGDPVPGAILFQSLAYILAKMMKEVSTVGMQLPTHLVSTLTDVPLYMKESFRANLPGYVKLFDTLSQKCDFLKQFIEKSGASAAHPAQEGDATRIAEVNAGNAYANPENVFVSAGIGANSLSLFKAARVDGVVKRELVDILDAISTGAYTVSAAAAEVLKELGDSPVYFQTCEGSMETYQMRYEKPPIAPLSMSLWFLRDIRANARGRSIDTTLYPMHALGSIEFRMAYGVRQLLTRSTPVTFEQVPSVKHMLDEYNGGAPRQEQFDEKRYLAFVQKVVDLLRLSVNARSYKSAICWSTNPYFLRSYMVANETGIQEVGPNAGVAVFPINAMRATVEATAVLRIVESSNQEEEIGTIAAVVSRTVNINGEARDLERIHNLIDMNIIPINVHALMRDIPLANLYNYEYTFEQMVATMFGEQSHRYTNGTIDNPQTLQTRQMFIRMLVDPYMEVTDRMYGSDVVRMEPAGFVHRIFRGDNDLGMGRPKFLSDQLFGKALFGSVYQNISDYDEAGPGVGAGRSRGLAQGVYSTLIGVVDQAILLMRGVMDPGSVAHEIDTRILPILTEDIFAPVATANKIFGTGLAGIGANNGAALANAGPTAIIAAVGAMGGDVGPAVARAAIIGGRLAGNAGDASIYAAGAMNGALKVPGVALGMLDALIAVLYDDGGANHPGAMSAAGAALAPGAPGGAHANLSGHLRTYLHRRARAVAKDLKTLQIKLQGFAARLTAARNAALVEMIPMAATSAVDTDIVAVTTEVTALLGSANALRIANVGANIVNMEAPYADLMNRLDYRGIPGLDAIPDGVNLTAPIIDIIRPSVAQMAAIAPARAVAACPAVVATPAGANAVLVEHATAIGAGNPVSPEGNTTGGVKSRLESRRDSIAEGAQPAGEIAAVAGRAGRITYLGMRNSAGDMAPDYATNRNRMAVKEVDVKSLQDKSHLQIIGKLRFDTRFVRNLFFIVNVVRAVRLKLNRELTQNRGVIVASHAATASSMTEYGVDPFTPNEQYDSRIGDGFDRDISTGAEVHTSRRGVTRYREDDDLSY